MFPNKPIVVLILLYFTLLMRCDLVIGFWDFGHHHHDHNDKADSNCRVAGRQCKDCNEVEFCVQLNRFEWQQIDLERCGQYETCRNGQCTNGPNPQCDGTPDLRMYCPKNIGFYPNPYDCSRYFQCKRKRFDFWNRNYAIPRKCPQWFGYNIRTERCDIRLRRGQCPEDEYPLPLCQFLGDNRALDGNQRIYYVCGVYPGKKILYPFMYRCPAGTIYKNATCGVPEPITTTSSTQSTEETSISTSSGSTSTTTQISTSSEVPTTDASTTSDVTSTPYTSSTSAVPTTSDASTTSEITSTPYISSTSEGPTTSEASTTSEVTSTPDISSTSEVPTTSEASTTSEVTSTPDISSTSEVPTTSEMSTTSEVSSEGTTTASTTD